MKKGKKISSDGKMLIFACASAILLAVTYVLYGVCVGGETALCSFIRFFVLSGGAIFLATRQLHVDIFFGIHTKTTWAVLFAMTVLMITSAVSDVQDAAPHILALSAIPFALTVKRNGKSLWIMALLAGTVISFVNVESVLVPAVAYICYTALALVNVGQEKNLKKRVIIELILVCAYLTVATALVLVYEPAGNGDLRQLISQNLYAATGFIAAWTLLGIFILLTACEYMKGSWVYGFGGMALACTILCQALQGILHMISGFSAPTIGLQNELVFGIIATVMGALYRLVIIVWFNKLKAKGIERRCAQTPEKEEEK